MMVVAAQLREVKAELQSRMEQGPDEHSAAGGQQAAEAAFLTPEPVGAHQTLLPGDHEGRRGRDD